MLRVFLVLLLAVAVWADQEIGGLKLPFKERLEPDGPGCYKAFVFGPLGGTPEAKYQFWVVDDPAPPAQKLASLPAHVKKFPFLAMNLRTTSAKIGPWPVTVMDGTGLGNQSMMIGTVAIATAEKLFVFAQFTNLPGRHQAFLQQLAGFQLGGEGLKDSPAGFSGEYRLGGLGLRSPSYLTARSVGKDADYASSYDAELAGTPQLVSCFYFLRELKPGDARGDAELFYSLAKKAGLPSELVAAHFDKPNEIVNEETPDWQIRCQFKRKGRVVAVLVRRCTPATRPAVDAVIVD